MLFCDLRSATINLKQTFPTAKTLDQMYSHLFKKLLLLELSIKISCHHKDGSTVRYVSTVRYASIFAKKSGKLVRYVGTVRRFCNGATTVRWRAL